MLFLRVLSHVVFLTFALPQVETIDGARTFLGVSVRGVTPALAHSLGMSEPYGALVVAVLRDSPAVAANILPGDVIVGADGQRIDNNRTLQRKIRSLVPDTVVRLAIFRKGAVQSVDVRLGTMPADSGDEETERDSCDFPAGIEPAQLTPDRIRHLGLPPGTQGVAISRVRIGSSAAEAGIRLGDVIQEVDGRSVTSVAECRAAIAQAAGQSALLLLNRRGGMFSVSVEVEVEEGSSVAIPLTFAARHLLGQTDDNAFMAQWAREVLEKGAAEKDPERRRETAIAFSLGTSLDPAVATLKRLATDKDHACREAAFASFAELGDPQFIPFLQPALEDEVAEVAFAAARALFRLGEPGGRSFLLAILNREEKGESGFFRGKLRNAARRTKTPKSALLFAAEQGVGFLPVPGAGEGYSALSELLIDKNFTPRATALLVLSSKRSPDTERLIEKAFEDSDWSVRAVAIQVAARWNQVAWKSRLVPLFQDSNRTVRLRAAAVFLRLNNVQGQAAKGALR